MSTGQHCSSISGEALFEVFQLAVVKQNSVGVNFRGMDDTAMFMRDPS